MWHVLLCSYPRGRAWRGGPLFPGALLLLALVAGACALDPVTRRPQLFPLSEQQEVVLGRQAFATFKRSRPVLQGGAAALLVRQTGEELSTVAPESSYAYSFHVLDTAEANAFALPGGVILVTRGLLLLCNDTDELAGVLGHEIGHVAAGHAAARSSWFARLPRLLAAPYERGQEREADRLGVSLAASVGYDPAALARVLARLEELRAAGDKSLPTMASHPSTPARLELMRALAAELEQAPREERGDWLSALDGMAVGDDWSRAALGDTAALLPEHGVRVSFPRGWVSHLREQTFLAVAPGGAAVLRLRVQSPDEARSDQASLSVEPGLVGTATLAPHGGWQITRSSLHYGDGQVARWYWLARGDAVLELVSDWPLSLDASYAPVLDAVARSLRPLTESDVAGLTVTRVRLATALAGESLAALAARTGSAWSAHEIALYNGLDTSAPLTSRCVLKIARREALRVGVMAPETW